MLVFITAAELSYAVGAIFRPQQHTLVDVRYKTIVFPERSTRGVTMMLITLAHLSSYVDRLGQETLWA